MDVEALAALAHRYGEGVRGHRPGLPLRRRSRAVLLRMIGKKQERKRLKTEAFKAQAAHTNRAGRNRTQDFVIPSTGECKPVRGMGKGKWKQWTPDAVLRGAFARENMGARDVADQIDGGSASQASQCKLFAAELILNGQQQGLATFLEEGQQKEIHHALVNMIFDETELEVNLHSFGLGAWSILASECQMTFKVDNTTHDFDIIRLPVAIPNKKATTMWPALCAGLGGLWPTLSTVPAKHRAVLVTCDSAPANIKLLGHLQSVVDRQTLVLPLQCVQHRTGNVVERITKLLSVLTGCYAVAKTLRSGGVVRRLTAHVKSILSEELQVVDRVPPGLADEWAAGQVSARQTFALVRQGDDEASLDKYDEFLAFFAGPWTGLGLSGVGFEVRFWFRLSGLVGLGVGGLLLFGCVVFCGAWLLCRLTSRFSLLETFLAQVGALLFPPNTCDLQPWSQPMPMPQRWQSKCANVV